MVCKYVHTIFKFMSTCFEKTVKQMFEQKRLYKRGHTNYVTHMRPVFTFTHTNTSATLKLFELWHLINIFFYIHST